MVNMAPRPGKVAIYVGSHRYLCQERCEKGFRSYFRESGEAFQMMETMGTLEEPHLGYEITRDR